jgi:hypothetical protein
VTWPADRLLISQPGTVIRARRGAGDQRVTIGIVGDGFFHAVVGGALRHVHRVLAFDQLVLRVIAS